MKKLTIILFILFDLLILPAGIYSFAPYSGVSVLDTGFLRPVMFVFKWFITLAYSYISWVVWAAISVAFTTTCLVIVHRQKELTPLYTCTMLFLCAVSIVCHMGAADFFTIMMGV